MNTPRMLHWVLGALMIGSAAVMGADGGVKITPLDGKVRVEIDGKLFTEYCHTGAPHVYFYPLLGPGGAPMTRNWPMQSPEGEEHDHPHHRSLWFSHGSVNGVDFWGETSKSGKILHDRFLETTSGAEQGTIRSADRWVAPDGSVTCTDERTFRVYRRPANERMFDFEVTLKAGDREVVLGDTKEGSMAIRLNESMKLTKAGKKPGEGHMLNSTGAKDGACWGKSAEWCDYWGPVDGKTLGVAIFDHPKNPVHPTWWHARDYGLFAANPFGVHDFEKKPAHTGDLKIPAGGSVTFRYRFLLHEGDATSAKIAERYNEYAGGKAEPAGK